VARSVFVLKGTNGRPDHHHHPLALRGSQSRFSLLSVFDLSHHGADSVAAVGRRKQKSWANFESDAANRRARNRPATAPKFVKAT
jgi:hypothetical protein